MKTKSEPTLFYVMGYPGAGKTTLAKNLAAKLGGKHLYGDKIAFELFTLPQYTPAEALILYKFMDEQAKNSLSEGQSVIYDISANTFATRSRLAGLARSCQALSFGLWVKTSKTTALKRCSQLRSSDHQDNILRVVPPPVFNKLVSAFESAHPDEHSIIEVAGTDNFAAQFKQIQKALGAITADISA